MNTYWLIDKRTNPNPVWGTYKTIEELYDAYSTLITKNVEVKVIGQYKTYFLSGGQLEEFFELNNYGEPVPRWR